MRRLHHGNRRLHRAKKALVQQPQLMLSRRRVLPRKLLRPKNVLASRKWGAELRNVDFNFWCGPLKVHTISFSLSSFDH